MEFVMKGATSTRTIVVKDGLGVLYSDGDRTEGKELVLGWGDLTPEAQEKFLEVAGFLKVAFRKAEKMVKEATAAAGVALAKAA